MKSKPWTEAANGIVIYFHVVAPDVPQNLLLAAGRGELHDSPTAAMPFWLFNYIHDTLRWIPTQRGSLLRVPIERPLITSEGALMARRVFAGWRDLFSIAEKDIFLTVSGNIPATKILIPRDDLVGCMASLEALTYEIESGEKVIYCSDTPDYRGRTTGEAQNRTPEHATIS